MSEELDPFSFAGYVGDGPIWDQEWKDLEWMQIATDSRHRALTYEESKRYLNGPKHHPFGHEAWGVVIDGRVAIFRSEEAYKTWLATST